MRSLFIKNKQQATSPWLWVLLVLALGVVAWVLHTIKSSQWPTWPDLRDWPLRESNQPSAQTVTETGPAPVLAEAAAPPVAQVSANAASEPTGKDSEGDAIDQQVQAFVSEWAAHWSARNLEGYFAAYAESFQPENKKPLAEWRQERKQRISSKSKIAVQVKDFIIVSSDHSGLKVHFTQVYEADGFRSTAPKILMLSTLEGSWKIIREYAP